MLEKIPNIFLYVVILGGGAGFLLFAVIGAFVFDKPSENSTAYVPEIPMAMVTIPSDSHIEVWLDAMIPLHTIIDIINVRAVDEEGNEAEEPGPLSDLFPLQGEVSGKGTVLFKIAALDPDDMPDLSDETKFNQNVVPMAYVRAATLTEFVKSILKFQAVCLELIVPLTLLTILGGLGAMGLGAIIIFFARQKNSSEAPTEVEKFDQTEE